MAFPDLDVDQIRKAQAYAHEYAHAHEYEDEYEYVYEYVRRADVVVDFDGAVDLSATIVEAVDEPAVEAGS